MDLSTRYLGLTLPHPLMLGACPIADDLDAVRRVEDAGAAAIVMRSMFEEQLTLERNAARGSSNGDSFAEALYVRSHRREFAFSPDGYLEQLRRVKDAVRLPVIASLNGTTNQAWLDYAKLVDQAGADAIELNVYRLSTNPDDSAETIERQTLDMVRGMRARTELPIAVKLSPYHTALANFADRLAGAGASGLVLFNRFYQPDIDVEDRAVDHRVELSSSSELLLRLRWVAILSAQVDVSLGVTGGVHSALDAVKSVMVGADGVQLVSEILKNGPQRFGELRARMAEWLEAHGYHSLSQLKDTMNLSNCPDPSVYERANYMRVLLSWKPPNPRSDRATAKESR
jgi:dihydroorotate dehydrogenase (fumarate)